MKTTITPSTVAATTVTQMATGAALGGISVAAEAPTAITRRGDGAADDGRLSLSSLLYICVSTSVARRTVPWLR